MNKAQSQNTTLVPKLRFPEFLDADGWEVKRLGDISQHITERVGSRELTPVSISAGIGFVPQAEKFGRDISGSQYQKYTVVRDGDFVYNKGNSLKYPQGCIYDLRDWGTVAAPNVFITFRLTNGFENGFFRGYFEQNAHGVQLKQDITSGARSNGLLNINQKSFFSIRFPTPTLPEQKKIAECLSSLDAVVEAESKKLDALKTYKKGLMQQLFPREGETVPRLRFPEFRDAGEWEVRRLGEVAETFSGGTPKSTVSEYYGGSIPFIRSAEIGLSSTALFLTDDGFKNSSAKLVDRGDILYALYGANSGDVAISQMAGAINQAILCIRTPSSNDFVYQYLAFKKQDITKSLLQGGQGNLSGELVKSIEIQLPSLPEQQRISSFLASLDAQIGALGTKLEQLKEHKRALMQRLFPVVV